MRYNDVETQGEHDTGTRKYLDIPNATCREGIHPGCNVHALKFLHRQSGMTHKNAIVLA
jgi:hypothetical protein